MRPELRGDAGEIVEGRDGAVGLGGIALAVAALVQRIDVEVRLERDAQRVPGMRVPGEAVQEEQRRAALPAPVQAVQAQAIDGQIAVGRPEEIHALGQE